MSELKITPADIGKRFSRRDGKVVTMTRYDDGALFPVKTDPSGEYTETGLYGFSGTSKYDLVERLDDDAAATPESVLMPSDATLRDYFAAKAMLGELIRDGREGRFVSDLAVMAYKIADAMLAERAKGEAP